MISVGDPRRAEVLAGLLDNPSEVYKGSSNRGFTIYTGKKNNVSNQLVVVILALVTHPLLSLLSYGIRFQTRVKVPVSIIATGMVSTTSTIYIYIYIYTSSPIDILLLFLLLFGM